MPAVLDRKTGAVISTPKYTADQMEKLEVLLVKAFLSNNPDFITKNIERGENNG